jgi:hypothetical protein
VRLLNVLLGTAANVLQIGGYPQGLVLSTGQLLFERLHTCGQVFTTGIGSLIRV